MDTWKIIDLTASPEPEESPKKAAIAVLAQFQPHKERGIRNVQKSGLPNYHSAPLAHARLHTGRNAPRNNVQEQSAVLHDRSFAGGDGALRSVWYNKTQSVTRGGSGPVPAQEESLAWLIKRSPHSSSTGQTGLTKVSKKCWENAQSNGRKRVSELGATLLNKTSARGLTTNVVQPSQHQNRIAHNTHDTFSHFGRDSSRSVLVPSKRLASTERINNDHNLNKRQHTSITQSGREDVVSQTRKTRLIDVTESAADEQVAFSDGTNDGTEMIESSSYVSYLVPMEEREVSLPAASRAKPHSSNHGKPFSIEEDELLKRLKQVDGLSWDDIVPHFNGRSRGSLQVRYSSKLAYSKGSRSSKQETKSPEPATRPKRQRKLAAADGFVSWAEAREIRKASSVPKKVKREGPASPVQDILFQQDRAFRSSMSRLLQQRELGRGGSRAWTSQTRSMSDELKEHTSRDYALTHHHHGTSGDVLSVSWSPDGTKFAAGSAAISDNASMQYNMSRNLLLGDLDNEELRELAEHHVPRPLVSGSNNVNALHAMRESQDSRLFVTVNVTAFSRDSKELFTAGKDKKVRVYSANSPLDQVECLHVIEHDAAVDVMSASNDGLVATGCHIPSQSINVYRHETADYQHVIGFSPSQSGSLTPAGQSLPLYPCSLKWGPAPQQKNLLLAGFCSDSISEDDRKYCGATCVWDVHTGQRLPLRAVTNNVFDLAWNPLPSSSSIAFAVASNSNGVPVSKGIKSIIQCFSPNQDVLRSVLAWQCPALDINDVIFCPYDANLIACGATNGKVYVWDRRFADRSQQPLHTLGHGDSLTVLPDIDRELIDTGVRFLSWGSSRTRLYSGSSDGIIKVWNPYRSALNAEVEEFTTPRNQRSAIMAGAFSSDSRHLLVGTETGQLNIFRTGESRHAQPASLLKLKLASAPLKERADPYVEANASISSGRVEIRPCGALPVRQAVQGLNYDGPFAITTTDVQQAQDAYQLALMNRDELRLNHAADETEMEKANVRVKDAKKRLLDSEDRLRFHKSCHSQALSFQRSLLDAEREQSSLKSALPYTTEPCRLGCEYFETTAEGATDSGCSELRIPGSLRFIQNPPKSRLESFDEIIHTSDAVCPTCHPLGSDRNRLVQCDQCKRKRYGLTATCKVCSRSTRPSTDETDEAVCMNCKFTCFRCGEPALVLPDVGGVHCSSCNLSWEAGVLGWELSDASMARLRSMTTEKQGTFGNHDGNDNDNDLGRSEVEHYASLWEARMPLR